MASTTNLHLASVSVDWSYRGGCWVQHPVGVEDPRSQHRRPVWWRVRESTAEDRGWWSPPNGCWPSGGLMMTSLWYVGCLLKGSGKNDESMNPEVYSIQSRRKRRKPLYPGVSRPFHRENRVNARYFVSRDPFYRSKTKLGIFALAANFRLDSSLIHGFMNAKTYK